MPIHPLTILWAAFAMSQLIFVVVAFVAWPGLDNELGSMPYLVAFIGLGTGFASLIVPRLLVPDDARTQYILRWAFAESATLCGFVATMIGGPQWLVAAAAAWSMTLLFLAIPRQDPLS